jgi:hypothetical protein
MTNQVICDCASVDSSATTFELRSGRDEAEPGFEPRTRRGSGSIVHVAPRGLDLEDVEWANVVRDETGQPMLVIRLTERGGAYLQELSIDERGKLLAHVFNGQVVQAATILGELPRTFSLVGGLSEREMCEVRCATGAPPEISPDEMDALAAATPWAPPPSAMLVLFVLGALAGSSIFRNHPSPNAPLVAVALPVAGLALTFVFC